MTSELIRMKSVGQNCSDKIFVTTVIIDKLERKIVPNASVSLSNEL